MTTNKIKVLLVEDHAVVRNGTRMMLSITDDIIVEGEASNVHEARALLKQKKFDIALVDVSLPGINGLEFLKSLRKERSKIPVLIFSMYPEEIYAMRALQLGAAGYLTKNSSIDLLTGAIRKVAQGGKYVSAALSERLAGILGGDSLFSHEKLSDRELEVFKLLAAGVPLIKIADILHLSASTITTYRSRILEKTGLKNNIELARYALDSGLQS